MVNLMKEEEHTKSCHHTIRAFYGNLLPFDNHIWIHSKHWSYLLYYDQSEILGRQFTQQYKSPECS